MTRLQVIQIIGNVIEKVNILSGSIPLDDPNQQRLLDLSAQLDNCQRSLAQAAFDENTQAFQQTADQLNAVDQQIRGTIRQVGDIQTTLANIERFLNAATSLVTLAGGFI